LRPSPCGTAILDVAALSFLGLGAEPHNPGRGLTIRARSNQILPAPWLSILPGIAIILPVVGLDRLGDAIRDVRDPRLTGAGDRARVRIGKRFVEG
jgi:peptide/nickel transport system permease protein